MGLLPVHNVSVCRHGAIDVRQRPQCEELLIAQCETRVSHGLVAALSPRCLCGWRQPARQPLLYVRVSQCLFTGSARPQHLSERPLLADFLRRGQSYLLAIETTMSKRCIGTASLLLLLVGCRFNNQERGEHQQRLVSLSKQYSEIIYALGAEKDLVAVDLSSTYPPQIKSLPTVGYHRALSAEGIVSVKPTMVLHDNNVGPEHVMRQLEQLKIPMKVFNAKGTDIESAKALVSEMGGYFHKEAAAERLNRKLDQDMSKAAQRAGAYSNKPK